MTNYYFFIFHFTYYIYSKFPICPSNPPNSSKRGPALYRCILRSARGRYGDNNFELEHIDGQDEVVGFVHGKKLELLGKLTVDCGREDNGHGGIFYQFFRKTSPVYKGRTSTVGATETNR